MKNTLLCLALSLVFVGCNTASSELEKRKELSQPVLGISNGTDGDRAMRRAAAKAIDALDVAAEPEIEAIALRILPGRGRFIVSAYWVGLEQKADGVEIAFSDGSKIETLFHKDENGTKGLLFFSAMVFSEDLPEPFNKSKPENVSTVTLMKAGKKCSNTITVTEPKPESTIWTDAVGANINDDLELWGFADPVDAGIK